MVYTRLGIIKSLVSQVHRGSEVDTDSNNYMLVEDKMQKIYNGHPRLSTISNQST